MAGEWDKFVYGPSKKEDEPVRTGSSWDDFVTPPAAPKAGITSSQFSSSIDRYQAGLYGVGEAVAGAVGAEGSAEWLKKQREENEQAADVAAQRARQLGAVDQWKDVHGVKDLGSYVKSLAIQSAPYAAEALAGGVLARGAMSGTRAALTAAEAAGDTAGVIKAKRALNLGSEVGGVAASYPSAVGDVLSNQREQNGTTNLLAAGALGVPYAALNAVGIESAMMKGELFRNSINLLDRPGGIGGALARTAATATGVGLKEGASETGQEMINQLGRMAVDEKAQFFGDEALDRYKESFVGGALLGGATGGVLGGWRRSGPDNDVSSAVKQGDQANPPITTGNFVPPAPPAMNGGTTDIALAQTQAKLDQEAADQAQLQEQRRTQAIDAFKLTSDPTRNVGQFLGVPVFSAQRVNAVADAMATATAHYDPVHLAVANAIQEANDATSTPDSKSKLLTFSFTADNIPKAVENGLNAIAKVATKFQIDHATSVEQAAQILDTLSTTAPKSQLEQINAVHQALTGEDTSGFIAAQQSKAEKGAKNGKQLPNNAGVRKVPVEGGTGETVPGGNGPVRPAEVQPVGATGLGEGSLGLQTGQPPASGVRASTGTLPTAPDGGGTTSDTQVNGQAQATVPGAAQVTNERLTDENLGTVPEVQPVEEQAAEGVPDLIRSALLMIYKSARKVDLLLHLTEKANRGDYATLAKEYDVSEQYVKELASDAITDEGQEYPRFIVANLDKFMAAVNHQAEQSGMSMLEALDGLQAIYDAYEGTPGALGTEVNEADIAAAGLAVQEREERTDNQGKKTGKSDLTNVTNIVDETDYADRANEAYLSEMDRYEKDPSETNKARLDAVAKAASAKNDSQAKKLYQEYQVLTGVRNAVQEQSTDEGNVRQPAGGGEAVGKGNAKPQKPARKGKQAKTEVKPNEAPTQVKTESEQAAEAWDAVASTLPGAPKFSELTEDERSTFIGFGPENWSADDVRTELVKLNAKFGIDTRAKNPYTVAELTKEIEDFIRTTIPSRKLVVVNSVEDLVRSSDPTVQKLGAVMAVEGAYGVASNGRAYLVANRIEKGLGRAKFMHEVGAHLGLEGLLPKAIYDKLTQQLVNWAKQDGKALESKLAKRAAERVMNAGTAKEDQRAELLAYFIEEAMQAGVNPTAAEKATGPLREWFRTLWAAFKVAVRRLGFRPEAMTAQDVVDMAYGAARLEMHGAYHGTAAEFRKFNHKFIGSGEGAQAFGWGTYLAQRFGIAKGYWKADVERKVQHGGPEGNLMRVDTAVDKDELLDWDAPLSKQPDILAKLEANIPESLKQSLVDETNLDLNEMNGEDLYRGLEFLEKKEGRVSEEFDVEDFNKRLANAKAKQIVSTYLSEIVGIPGLKFLDSQSRVNPQADIPAYEQNIAAWQEQIKRYEADTSLDERTKRDLTKDANGRIEDYKKQIAKAHAYKPTQNLVIFNDKDIFRIGGQVAADRGRMRFGIESTLPPAVAKPAKSVVTNLATAARNGLLSAGITEDIVNMASKYMRSAGDYLTAQYARQKTRLEFEMRIERIEEAFERLPKELQGTGANSVNRYILDSTMSKKWGYYPGEHRIGTELFEEDPELAKRFNAFPEDAQQVIRDVFEHGYTALKMKQDAVNKAVEREFAEREKAAIGDADALDELQKARKEMVARLTRLQNLDFTSPYAYLGRYGDYVVVGKSKEFKHWQERAKLNDFDVDQAQAWLADNVSNPDHYVVQFVDTQGEADQVASELIATGKFDMDGTEAGPKEDVGSYSGSDVHLAVARLRTLADRQQGEGTEELDKLLSDLYLLTAAENSARKSEVVRKYVSGADANMMRNLATSGRADAHFLSTMEHNDDITDAMERMRDEARNNRREAMPLYNELFRRQTQSLNYNQPAILGRALTQATSAWFLATSPAFYLQQILQTGVLSVPYMAGRLGYFRSVRAVKSAYTDVAALVKGLGIGEHIDFSKAPADVRPMLQALVGMGKIDIGIDSDTKARASEHGPVGKVMRKLQNLNSRIEAINRATAAIAAYRGYIQRYGAANTDAATKFAAEVVSNTHGSYDGFNTPRVLNSDFGRVLGQFKRFQIIQLSMLGKLIHTSFKGASAEEKAIARRALAFIGGHMAVLGGALGVPFVQQIGALMTKLLGDEDEPDDFEYKMRQMIGDKTMADLLLNGVPAALGVNVGGKLGMGNVASVLPFTDVDLASRSGYEKMMVGLMGPFFGGLMPKFVDGAGMIAKGEYYKGLELLAPNGIGNAMKGIRYANEGITMRNGDVVLKPEDISFVDAAFQAVGLPTTTITGRQYAQRTQAEFDKFYTDRASEVKGAYVNASRNGDSQGMADARKEWQDLQDSRRRNGYKVQPMSELFKATVAARRREANVVGGVETNKANKAFAQQLI